MAERFTIIDETRATEVEAAIGGGRITLSPDAVERALGWTLKPEGFCRDEVCVPVREGSRAVQGDRVDLAAFAELFGRPVASDTEERVAVVGASEGDRGRALSSLNAPEFALPDLDGRVHSLSSHRGKKVFLAVWASW
jgi:hypothetical protein